MNKKVSKRLKKIDCEKDQLLIDLKNSCAICDALQVENTVLITKVNSLEKELNETNDHLNKLSSNRLKNMLGVHKPSMSFDTFGASTSYACASINRTTFVKHVKANKEVEAKVAGMDKGKSFCLHDYMNPKSMII